MSASALQPDITGAILLFLPAKSLGRFKSVSKTWNSLISDPQFIKNHLQRHKTTTKLILVSHKKYLYSLDTNQFLPYLNISNIDGDDDDDDIPATVKELSFESPIQWEQILGSCNGLLLATTDVDRFIFLVNPTTWERWEVPLPFFAPPDGEYFIRYGFGYDASADDYKVVSILFSDPESNLSSDFNDTLVSVYTLRDNSWKRLPNSPYDHATFDLVKGALVNQNFHWLASASIIIAFSFATEEFNEIRLQLPDSYGNENVRFYNLFDVGGKLGVFLGIHDGYELWVMEEYGVGLSWNRVCRHEFRYPRDPPFKPVCLVEGSNRDIVLNGEGDVYVFNIDERRCKKVRIEGEHIRIADVCTYVESLKSPKHIIRAA